MKVNNFEGNINHHNNNTFLKIQKWEILLFKIKLIKCANI